MSEYEVFYPGKYSDEDKALLAEHQKKLDKVNNRGEIDLEALCAGKLGPDTPGVSPRVQTVVDYESTFETLNYDPDNPLYTDSEYAKAAGYNDKITIPMTGNVGMYWAEMPAPLRDNIVVSGLNHTVNFHKPAYVGDTLYAVTDNQWFEEYTPEDGSEYRTFGIFGSGRVYNQRGELVCDGTSRTKESLRRHTDPAKRRDKPIPVWECPKWWDRPMHYYTDADWATIKGIWANENRRGMEPLYWEDVNVGDEPTPIAEGPMTALDQIKYHGLHEIGDVSLKKAMSDPMLGMMLNRDEKDGMYYYHSGVGHLEEGREPGRRAAFYNFMPVNHAIRMLNDWAGDKAWVKTISWRIMNELPGYEKDIPDFPASSAYVDKVKTPTYIENVPYLKGQRINIHGLVGDLVLCKAYICDKYVAEDGKHCIDLIWWCETVDGLIYQEGFATLELPSKS